MDSPQTQRQGGQAESLSVDLGLFIDDGPLAIEDYPREYGWPRGSVGLRTTGEGVFLTAGTSLEDRQVSATLELSPAEAEALANLLVEFAEKARADEDWIYP